MSAHHHESDMKPAFTGLIVGLIALLIMCMAVVMWTNSRFASHKPVAEATP